MSAADPLREAVEAVLSNEEHAFSGGMSSYAKGSPTWQVYEDLRQALAASLAVPDICLTITQDPESKWWLIKGDCAPGLFIANPSLDLCLRDVLPAWRMLAHLNKESHPDFGTPAPLASPTPKVPA